MTTGSAAATSNSSKSSSFQCLLLEDDEAFASLLTQVIRGEGGDPTHCNTIAKAMAVLQQRSFDLVILDNHLPDGRAYDVFDRISRQNPEAPVIMMTGAPILAEAVSLTRNGLFDYLTKPVSAEALANCLTRVKARLAAKPATDPSAANQEWYGNAAVMRDVYQQISQASRHSTATVLFTGETGAGKDLAARLLHQLTHPSGGSNHAYIPVNCAALPSEMFEAELFGAERGAYTGADRKRQGLASAAQHGTLFLDEIGEVPLTLQSKLLRLLEGREFRALGSTESQNFTGRFVAATNKSLRNEVVAGRFREDLLFRLEVITIELPPLRARADDIPGLAERMLTQLAKRYERDVPILRPEDLQALLRHPFPGNIRELRNLMERALLRTNPSDRWLAFDRSWLPRASTAPAGTPTDHTTSLHAAASRASAQPGSAQPTPPAVSLPPERAGLSALEAQEYQLIKSTMAETGGAIRKTASKLGLSPQALLRRLEKWPELRGPE